VLNYLLKYPKENVHLQMTKNENTHI